MSMSAVRTIEQIGAQYRCTTDGKCESNPPFVLAYLQ